tara:strand:+ start:290 stop:439 length:150 start_codon:yes stop_codon:yes gene_type:complete
MGNKPNKHLKKIISLVGILLDHFFMNTSIITKDKTENIFKTKAKELLFI